MELNPSLSGKTFRVYNDVVMLRDMGNDRTSSHRRHDIKYHFVWVTKYRKSIQFRNILGDLLPAES